MSDEISPELAEAFDQAVLAYASWDPQNDRRQIPIPGRGYFSISAICGLVDQFSDRMPDKVIQQLRSYVHDHPDGALMANIVKDPSYATGASCLRSMIERRTPQ
jgi:hypothetical protein